MMKRSIVFLTAVLLAGAAAWSQEAEGEKAGVDFSQIADSRKEIDSHVKLLQDKNIELKDLPAQLQKLDKLVEEIKTMEEGDQKKRLASLAELNSDILLRETSALVAYTKRLELLYLMMASFGILVILSILGYSLFMYMRRGSADAMYDDPEEQR